MSDLISKEKVLELIIEKFSHIAEWNVTQELRNEIKSMPSERTSDYGRPCKIRMKEEVYIFKYWHVGRNNNLIAVVEDAGGLIYYILQNDFIFADK